jgi:hypothetical protein
MNKEAENEIQKLNESRTFDSPLIFKAESIDGEPEKYIAEKPFDLTRYEYSILKKAYKADFWYSTVSGGTAGILVSVVGKSISTLIAKQNPTLEIWEVIAIIAGVVTSLILKFLVKTEDDKEKNKLMKVIDNHFESNKPRNLHITKEKVNEK